MTGPQDPNESVSTERTYSAAELRDARRKARSLGLDPRNGAEAVAMLTERGIEIGKKEISATDTLQGGKTVQGGIATPSSARATPAQPIGTIQPTVKAVQKPSKTRERAFPMVPAGNGNLPMQQTPANQVPSVQARAERQREIKDLENRMKNRRSRRLMGMFFRFAIFVMLPTLLFAYYQWFVATPLYSVKAQLGIEESVGAEGQASTSLFNIPGLGGDDDALSLQNYMDSRHIFARLEQDFDLPAIFMSEDIDRFSRVEEDASGETRFKTYGKYVVSKYDTTERILKLEVKTPDPDSGLIVSNFIINYAEDRLDETSENVKSGNYERALKALENAELDLEIVKQKKLTLQDEIENSTGATEEIALVQSLIAEQEAQLNQKRVELRTLQANTSPNSIRVRAVQREIDAIEFNITELNARAREEGSSGKTALDLAQEILLVDADIAAKQAAVETQRTFALSAEAEFNEQKKFLTTMIPPTASFEPIYPKKLFSVIAVFFICFATYLFIAMTIEIIREQVSA